MNELKQFNELFKEHKYPCFIVDIKTHKILYYNLEMEKLLAGRDDILGHRFYDIIKNHNAIYTNDFGVNWDVQDSFKYNLYDESLQKGFHVIQLKIELGGTFYNFSKYIPSDSPDNSFEETMNLCIDALQQTEDEKNNSLLKILGEFYHAESALLCQIDRANHKIPCVAFWSKMDDSSFHKVRTLADQILNLQELLLWFQDRNEIGMLEISQDFLHQKEDAIERKLLETFQLQNLVVAVIEDSHREPLGVLVLSNRSNYTEDFRLLQTVTRFMEKDVSNSELQATVSQLSHSDLLTGFQNRVSYSEKLEEFQSNPPKSLGVLLANVNGLKKINAEYGYARGDSFIKKAAEFLKLHLNPPIYRISGDEFICFFPNIEESALESIYTPLLEHLEEDENKYFALGYSWQKGPLDPIKLLKEADTVMYINKQKYYHDTNRKCVEITDTTLSNLLTYLENDEFMIYLQPQLLLEDGSLYGAEALIRRFDKTNGRMVFPDQFIPLYEQKSVIRHVDIFVVKEVCKLLASWHATKNAIPISVNLSRVTLLEYGIVDTITEICDQYQVPHHLLIIEVTERVGLIENNVASSLISQFKANGFRISLDDFGCAYSNIVTLAQIEVDEVKIDKSLVDFLVTNSKNRILVKNVLSMCNELEGASTLAEGIEDQEQANLLHELGCHLGQGYFYSRPIPVPDFMEKYINHKESKKS